MTNLIIKFEIPGFHKWTEAPQKCSYLSNLHRHIFYFEIEIKTTKDREQEIILLKDNIREEMFSCFNQSKLLYDAIDFGDLSCEQIAKKLYKLIKNFLKLEPIKVTVLEDNENGSSYYEE